MYILCVVLRCCALRFRTARLTTSFAPTLKAFTDRGIGSRSRAGYCATGFPCWPEAIEPMMANRPSQNSNKAQEATLTKQNESKCRAKLYGTQTGILSYKLKQHPSGPWQSHLVIFFKGFARMWLIHAWRRELSSQNVLQTSAPVAPWIFSWIILLGVPHAFFVAQSPFFASNTLTPWAQFHRKQTTLGSCNYFISTSSMDALTEPVLSQDLRQLKQPFCCINCKGQGTLALVTEISAPCLAPWIPRFLFALWTLRCCAIVYLLAAIVRRSVIKFKTSPANHSLWSFKIPRCLSDMK